MKELKIEIPYNEAYILPIGDLHIGDRSFDDGGYQLIQQYIQWVKDNSNVRVFLNGDIFNVATRTSKTSPHGNDTGEFDRGIDLFMPIKNRIIGAVEGNHELRMVDHSGLSPTRYLCRALGVTYCEHSAIVNFTIGKKSKSEYSCFFHHTASGGGTIGAGLNAVYKQTTVMANADIYFGSHNHNQAAGVKGMYQVIDGQKKFLKQYFVDCGAWMGYEGNYGEGKMYTPNVMGTPIVKLAAKSKKISILIGDLETLI